MDQLWKGAPELKGASAEERWVEVAPKVSLRVLSWKPDDAAAASQNPVVMVPGWGSVFEGWRPLVTEWVRRRPLYYIETRDKGSARIDRPITKSDFPMEKHGEDVAAVLEALDIDQSEIDWYSSSLGATLLIDAYQRQALGGRSSVLLAPNPDFDFPLWSRIMINFPLPMFVYRRLVNFVAWVVDRRTQEEGQKIRYRRALLAQNVRRMLLSARANLGYSLPDDLSSIKVPCAVMTASSDTLHGIDKVHQVVDAMPNCLLIEVSSNQYAHEPGVLAEIEEFQSSVVK
ncbi:MAG: alpha/beta hydrolase [Candidatus Thalassarchaeaceae archaeon]|jgi:pimeloyl-ACP methyl ester carboxylesterase|nr:alpha/beta hydrolase [Candidatus Thalassarchaeaceae archaeon]